MELLNKFALIVGLKVVWYVAALVQVDLEWVGAVFVGRCSICGSVQYLWVGAVLVVRCSWWFGAVFVGRCSICGSVQYLRFDMYVCCW